MSSGAFEFGQMWTTYQEMEEEFIGYLSYVPFTSNNRKVYSPKLLRLLLQIGGYIDTAFKEISFYKEFDENTQCSKLRTKVKEDKLIPFNLYLDSFEPIYHLSKRPVVLKMLRTFTYRPVIIDRFPPFQIEEGKITPKWWQAYNAVKHNMIKNIEEANIENTLFALAGAFCLNAIYEPSLLALINEGIATMYELKPLSWEPLDKGLAKDILCNNGFPDKQITVSVDSKLFKLMVPRSLTPRTKS
jgi:hypothetical protein